MVESASMSMSGTAVTEPVVLNGKRARDSGHCSVEANLVRETKGLVSELCRHVYTLGWVSGTGGSITIKVHDPSVPRPSQLIVMSPSGVQKEKIEPEDMYVLSCDGCILSTPLTKLHPHKPPKCTDCAPLFLKAYEMCKAGAVIHSHGMEACLVTMINPLSEEFRITHMEMIKGIQGHGYHDELVVPIIENTAHEGELVESFTQAIIANPKTTAVLVRNHGVYIWGDTWISAKTQAECYHYLFDASIKMHQLGLDWFSAGHACPNGVSGYSVNLSHGLRRRTSGLDRFSQLSQSCILVDIKGTTSPISFVTKRNSQYSNDNMGYHLRGPYDVEETPESIHPLQYLDQILIHPLQTELGGVIFDEVPEVLGRWYASGIKVYLYSTCSREEQRLLVGNTIYGDLSKYICGYFDPTLGSKTEARCYLEIMKTVGVDRPGEMLFVTRDIQAAMTAKAVGLEVAISSCPENRSLPETEGSRIITSLLEECYGYIVEPLYKLFI